MTNLEALQSLINLDIPNLHEKILIDNGISAVDDYLAENKSTIELCSAYVYKVELTHPDFSEGGLKIASNKEELIKIMNAIFKSNNREYEAVEQKPTIKFMSL
jgi:hypothetical protein